MKRKARRTELLLYLERDPYTSVVPRLEPRALRALSRELPRPGAVYTHGQATIEVFKAKELYHPAWKNPALFRLVIDARGSYERYGDYPPLDAYDRKSAIYLARVRFTAPGIRQKAVAMEEWLAMRFIPWRGTPYGFDDLKLCAYKGKTADAWFQKKFPRRDGNHLIVSLSRICGIHPYPVRALDDAEAHPTARHRFTALAFAAINNEFFNMHASAKNECAHVTALIHPALAKKALMVRKGKHAFAPGFAPAHWLLGLASAFALHRDGLAGQYCFRFPQYFLDTSAIARLLGSLAAKGVLPATALAEHLGDSSAAERFLSGKPVHITALRGLGKIFSAEGVIAGTAFTGAGLRALAKNIPDGPALQLMEFEEWRKSIAALVAHGGLTRLP